MGVIDKVIISGKEKAVKRNDGEEWRWVYNFIGWAEDFILEKTGDYFNLWTESWYN